MDVSDRLAVWVRRTFPAGSADRVLEKLRTLPADVIGGQDVERIQASLVLQSRGSFGAFTGRLIVAGQDWRDALVGAGLGDDDWRARLDTALGIQDGPAQDAR